MEQPPLTFYWSEYKKGTIVSLWPLSELQQQSVELQFDERPRKKLLFSGLTF